MDHSRAHSRGFGQTDSSGRGPWGVHRDHPYRNGGGPSWGLGRRFVGRDGTGVTGFNIWSILVATVGAIVVLAVYRLWRTP